MTFKSDKEILEALRAGAKRQHLALTHVYQTNWPVVRGKVMQWGGTEEDAKEVFQVGVTELYHIICHTDRFRGDSKIATFLISICRHLWLRELRTRKRTTTHLELLQADAYADQIPEDTGAWIEQQEQVKKAMDGLDERCRELLVQYYYHQRPMADIAVALGLKTAQVAKAQKWRCKEKLRKLLKG